MVWGVPGGHSGILSLNYLQQLLSWRTYLVGLGDIAKGLKAWFCPLFGRSSVLGEKSHNNVHK